MRFEVAVMIGVLAVGGCAQEREVAKNAYTGIGTEQALIAGGYGTVSFLSFDGTDTLRTVEVALTGDNAWAKGDKISGKPLPWFYDGYERMAIANIDGQTLMVGEQGELDASFTQDLLGAVFLPELIPSVGVEQAYVALTADCTLVSPTLPTVDAPGCDYLERREDGVWLVGDDVMWPVDGTTLGAARTSGYTAIEGDLLIESVDNRIIAWRGDEVAFEIGGFGPVGDFKRLSDRLLVYSGREQAYMALDLQARKLEPLPKGFAPQLIGEGGALLAEFKYPSNHALQKNKVARMHVTKYDPAAFATK